MPAALVRLKLTAESAFLNAGRPERSSVFAPDVLYWHCKTHNCGVLWMTETKKLRDPEKLWQAAGWLWLAAAWLAGMAFLWRCGHTMVDSDMASEMVLADLLNREGGVLSRNWYYSTELRVFCQQLLFKLGLLVFPASWHAARMLAQGLLSALLAGSYLFFARGAGLWKSAPWAAGALLCPFGFWQLYHGVFGGFYFVHMTFVLVSFGLAVRLGRPAGRPRTALTAAALALVSFAAGLNGVRLLMNLYVPLAAACCLLLVLRFVQAPLGPGWTALPQVRAFAAALVAGVCSLAGYAVNSRVLAGSYFFQDQSGRSWTALSLTNLLTTWGDFLALFGYPADRWQQGATGAVPLFSLSGLLGAAGILLAGAVVVSLVWLLKQGGALPFAHQLTGVTLAACLLVDGLAYACMNDMNGINGSYWLPVAPLAIAAVAATAENIPLRRPALRRALAVCLAALVVCASTGTTLRFVTARPHDRPGLVEVAGWLEEQGYTRGWATFWQANVITELTDGAIEMWQTEDLASLQMRPWLQKTSHAAPPEGRVFVLAAPGEINQSLPWAGQAQVVWSDEMGWVVFELEQ